MSNIHLFRYHNKKVYKISFNIEDFLELNKYEFTLKARHGKKDYFKVSNWKGEVCRQITKCPDNLVVDHKNGNSLDNRKENLRICNLSENNCNRRKHKNATSKYKGVSFHKDNTGYKLWRAAIGKTINGKEIKREKHFLTEIEAAKQYNEWALELHGEFAVLNELG